jgi:hypothetical protein
MPDYGYPSAIELRQVAQELVPRMAANRVAFQLFPLREVNTSIMEWEQKDNYTGLQAVRGLNGMPSRVKATGGKRYLYNPGTYGEFETIDEKQITERRPWGGPFGMTIDLSDLVREKQDKLLQRELDRQELTIWTLMATGTFSVSDGTAILHTDSYTTQTFAAGVAWATAATSTPLSDLRAVQLKSRGYSVNFGAQARAYLNRSTLNAALNNTNSADIFGRRTSGLQTINSLEQANALLAADDLPQLVPYDRGYIDDTGTFQLFIPNNKVIVVGARDDNDPVGEYRLTRNANNPDAGPGSYDKIVDDPDSVPRTVEVHRGHNGGVVIWHPAAIVVMTV